MTRSLSLETPRFASPEEEIAYLRERVRAQQEQLGTEGHFDHDRIAEREVEYYGNEPASQVLHEAYIMPEHETIHTVLKLEPETHDAQIDALLRLVMERGIRNALAVAARTGNPHLEDDFHRMLVRYVAEGLPVNGAPASERIDKALHLALFEIQPQAHSEEEKRAQKIEDALASSEQLYTGLLALIGPAESFSLEIAVPQGTEEAILYLAVPGGKRHLAERLVSSLFPGARVTEARGDYNVFSERGFHAGAEARLGEHPALPLKCYGAFSEDPLRVVLATFSRIAKHGEGAALQIVVGNERSRYNDHYAKILKEVEKGEPLKKALSVPETVAGTIIHDIGDTLKSAFFSSGMEEKKKEAHVDDAAREALSQKTGSRIVPVNIRVVTSAESSARARELLQNIAGPFNQFDDVRGNRLQFAEKAGGALKELFHSFSFRLLEPSSVLPLNIAELTTLYHFTAERVHTSRELKRSRGKQAPAPLTMPGDGVRLGLNRHGSSVSPVLFGATDRLRHCYVVGQTGTGKTTMIKNMIVQDIERGEGVGFIDPHGNDIQHILAAIPNSRRKDVIYFDPAAVERPMGLNILEYDRGRAEQKTMVVDELLGILNKLFGAVPESMGPAFEQYFRNAALLVMDDPDTGNTLLDIARIFANDTFRALKLMRCKNPIVRQFWMNIALKADGEQALGNYGPYVTNKFDPFTSNEVMRPIIAQEKSAFNFRDIMDTKKIFLANLSKGRLGERNMGLLGLVLVSKFAQAAFARADDAREYPPYYLYIDEFQNFTTPSISAILSEARKYKLSLTIAHQFMAQLSDGIRDAVIGNVGTKCVFRVGTTDAEFLKHQFEPVFTAADLSSLENYTAAVALLVNGVPATPFSMETEKPKAFDAEAVEALKELSYRTYGRDRAEIEAEIEMKLSRGA